MTKRYHHLINTDTAEVALCVPAEVIMELKSMREVISSEEYDWNGQHVIAHHISDKMFEEIRNA